MLRPPCLKTGDLMTSDASPSTLGRLKSLGIEDDWQVAYLLPKKHEDLSLGTPEFGALNADGSSLLIAMVASEPQFNHGPPPRLNVELMCKGKQQVSAVAWGGTQEAQAQLTPKSIVYLKGQPGEYNGRPQFRIEEIISPEWAGRLRPVYPGKKGVINSALVTERVLERLDEAIPIAAQDLRKRLASIAPESELLSQVAAPVQSYDDLLRLAHLPDTAANAEAALAAVERLAAIDMLMRARDESGGRMRREPIRLMSSSLQARETALPYPLTDEQKQAVEEITADLRRPETMRRLLSGDVGTGKTAVYGTAAAAAYDAGARVAIMLPNVNLATQVFNEIREYWPDIPAQLVSGDLDKKTDLKPLPFLVGTTALLHRDIGDRDLVISDEQQKFSVEQREQMAGMDGHLLEVSATCIPRSQALLKFGVVDLSVLSKGHVEKEIHTRIRRSDERVELFADAMKTINEGHQLAVVYPLKENSESEDGDQDRRSAVNMVKSWEKHFPGRVRLLHGQMTDDEKQAVIADMKADRADILVSTTVIEVGLTLPRLRRLLVVSADRHGLTGLHQLRGRLARHGGTGYFDLFLPNEDVNPDTLERLSILEQTTDGFAVAEHDLFMRGYGNLAGKKQSGTDSGFLCAHPIEASRLSEVINLVPDMSDQRPDPVPLDSVKESSPLAVKTVEDHEDDYLLDARGNHKWFSSRDKAEQFMARKGIATHEIVEENNRFYMRRERTAEQPATNDIDDAPGRLNEEGAETKEASVQPVAERLPAPAMPLPHAQPPQADTDVTRSSTPSTSSAFDTLSEEVEAMFAPARTLDQMVYRTQSGRITSPGIRLDFSSAEALKTSRAELREWLIQEAREEAYAQEDPQMVAALDGCSSENWTVEKGDMINLYLFNDITGDLTKHQATTTAPESPQDEATDVSMELDHPARSQGHQMSLV
jgi:ATP-dependent DNA helicase RecG